MLVAPGDLSSHKQLFLRSTMSSTPLEWVSKLKRVLVMTTSFDDVEDCVWIVHNNKFSSFPLVWCWLQLQRAPLNVSHANTGALFSSKRSRELTVINGGGTVICFHLDRVSRHWERVKMLSCKRSRASWALDSPPYVHSLATNQWNLKCFYKALFL